MTRQEFDNFTASGQRCSMLSLVPFLLSVKVYFCADRIPMTRCVFLALMGSRLCLVLVRCVRVGSQDLGESMDAPNILKPSAAWKQP